MARLLLNGTSTQMQSECDTRGILLSDVGIDEEGIQLIFEGARRDLKLRQTKMIRHTIAADSGKVVIETGIDVFARGRKLVIGSVILFLIVIVIAVFKSSISWAEQIALLKSLALIFLVFIPLAYGYLIVEKRSQNHRLKLKMEVKLKSLIDSKPKIQEMLGASNRESPSMSE